MTRIAMPLLLALLAGCSTPHAARDLAGKTSGFLAETTASVPALTQSLQAQNALVNRQVTFERTLRDAALVRSGNIERQWEYIEDDTSARKQRLMKNIRRDDAALAQLAAPPPPPTTAAASKAVGAPNMGAMTLLLADIASDKGPGLEALLAYGKATNSALEKIEEDAEKAKKDVDAVADAAASGSATN